jgi:hypothetical protein
MEVPKRLRPTLPTIRTLFAHSGNQCAFPDCAHPLIDQYGNFVAQVCHIESAELGGERFNAAMTNEERRMPANLMLMCLRHHVETNDVIRFPVARLRQMKEAHERQFAEAQDDERFDEAVRAIAESTIVDLTKRQTLELPTSMTRWCRVLYESDDFKPRLWELTTRTVLPTLETLRKLPVDTRSVLSIIIDRGEPDREDVVVPAQEIELATGTDYETLHGHVAMLERYGLLYIWCDEETGVARFIVTGLDGWPFWADLKRFCALVDEPLETFLIDLRFDLLD